MITKEKFFDDIKNIYHKYGYINRTLLCNEITEYNVNWQLSKYHGLKSICKQLGIEYIDYSAINKDDLIKDILRVYNICGCVSVNTYDRYGNYSSSAVKTHFGSFNNCLKTLGIKRNMTRNDSKEEIEKDFWEFYNKYHTTSSTLYRQHGNYSQSVIKSRYGSWVSFIESIGLKASNKRIGLKKMLEDVRLLYEEYGYLSSRLINDNCQFSYQALHNYLSLNEIADYVNDKNAFKKLRSRSEKVIYKILTEKYSDVQCEFSKPWLINDKTGNRLYIDFYIPEINLAIEYDGQQHEKYIPYLYGNSYKKFYNQVYRDRLKERLLKYHGIKLVRIKHDEPITKDNIYRIISSV